MILLMGIAQKISGFRTLLQFDNWPVLMLARVFDRRTGLVTYRKGSLEVLVDHHGGDENGTRACLVSDMYRKHLQVMGLSGPLRVLDLGANGGGFPLMLLLDGFDVVQAVCVEMSPSTAQRLIVNLDTNLNERAVGINAAVCGAKAQPEILIERTRGGTGLSMYAGTSPTTRVAVPTVTMSALCERYFQGTFIDLCKIDIEGAEYDALETAPDEVLSKIRNLIIEFHDPSRTPHLIRRLLDVGFREISPDPDTRTGDHTEVRSFRREGRSGV